MFDAGTRCVVVVGAQWGDEGKGKLVDVLAERADFVVRYQGGANAGHPGVTGSDLNKLVPIVTRLAKLFVENDMTLAEINPLAELEDGTFVALDAHMDMENEARPRQHALLTELGVGPDETRQAREATPFELAGEAVDGQDHRGVGQAASTRVADAAAQRVELRGGAERGQWYGHGECGGRGHDADAE